jgi:hypothetical protein
MWFSRQQQQQSQQQHMVWQENFIKEQEYAAWFAVSTLPVRTKCDTCEQ